MIQSKITEQEIVTCVRNAQDGNLLYFQTKKEAAAFALRCIDLTSLEGSDTDASIADLCHNALCYTPQPATVCVYPVFAKTAKRTLADTAIGVACVAGAFPSGQSPLALKLEEVHYALQQGADEIDMVMPRGKFLERKYDSVFNEIHSLKTRCKDKKLKVILETGALQYTHLIALASEIAIAAGADFIKTSTGKTAFHTTPEAFASILFVIQAHYEKTGKKIGIKPAGGIADVETTLLYIKLIEQILGKAWLDKSYFRIGASRLANTLATFIASSPA
jgi:deoxyribose-phosphate aldolase